MQRCSKLLGLIFAALLFAVPAFSQNVGPAPPAAAGATDCAGLSDSGPFCSGTNAASLTGTLAAARLPAFTGDVTTSAGSSVTTLATAQSGAHTWAVVQTFTLAPVFTDQSGSRTALGLGTAAVQNTGTSGANVPLLNGANTWSTTQTFTLAPVFTDQSGSRTALGLVAIASSGSASDLSAGTVASARGGAGTINGALKGNGSGVVSQAACADLSNATSYCSAAVGNLPGASTNTAPSAGNIGQSLENSSGSLSLTTITAKSTASISLTAGSWRVCGNGGFDLGSGTTATTLITMISATQDSISGTSINNSFRFAGATLTGGATIIAPPPCVVVRVNSTTTYYLNVYAEFTVSTASGYGFISAVRIN